MWCVILLLVFICNVIMSSMICKEQYLRQTKVYELLSETRAVKRSLMCPSEHHCSSQLCVLKFKAHMAFTSGSRVSRFQAFLTLPRHTLQCGQRACKVLSSEISLLSSQKKKMRLIPWMPSCWATMQLALHNSSRLLSSRIQIPKQQGGPLAGSLWQAALQ